MTTREAVKRVLHVTRWITARDLVTVYRCFAEAGLVPERTSSGIRARLAEIRTQGGVAYNERRQEDGTVVGEYTLVERMDV